jgi:YD repeat-containing protein
MNTRLYSRMLAGVFLIHACLCHAKENPLSVASQIAGRQIFQAPIDWVGVEEPPTTESEALLAAIGKFDQGGLETGIEALESFIAANPGSAWSPSLHMNLAEYYRGGGGYSRALTHWEKAWNATKSDKAIRSKRVSTRSIAQWTRLLASLGEKDQLSRLFAELDQLQLPLGSYGSFVQGTREGLTAMIFRPEMTYRCGSFALGHLAKELHTDGTIIDALFAMPSPDGGFHMDQLVSLAQSNGLPLVAVRRPAGEPIIIPSVIHWKLNHYAAILDKKDNRYHVMDPTFGGDVWMSMATIDDEASGAFLVPKDKAPPGWQRLSQAECSGIYGKGQPNIISDDEDPGPDPCDPDEEDSNCDPPSSNDGASGGDDPPPPPPCDCGMPIWKISEPYITLWLEDTPLLYRLSNQKWMGLKMRYKHTGEFKGNYISSFGDKWECNFLSYLTLSTNNLAYYTNHMAGGGVQAYSTGSSDYRTRRSLVGETGHGLAIVTPTGAKNRYGLTNALPGGLTFYFLTQRLDRYGRVLETFNYLTNSGMIRLSSVVDMDGNTISFSYNLPVYQYLITGITNPYGISCQFYYDTSGTDARLSYMVDAMNMTNSFTWDGNDFITSMTTPYAGTSFSFYTGYSSNYFAGTLRRTLDITEPTGVHQMYAYCDSGPSVGAFLGLDSCAGCRNTYHWNRVQYTLIPMTDLINKLDMPPADYNFGEVKHWLHGWNQGSTMRVSDTLRAFTGPADNTGTREPATYYDYQNQTNSAYIGTAKLVTNVTWNTYQLTTLTRNTLGRPISTINYNYTPSFGLQSTPTYINTFDAPGVVLQKVQGPNGELVRGYGYDPVYNNLLTSVTNALGEVTRYTYDTNTFKVTSILFSTGLLRTNVYFSSGANKGFLALQADWGFRTNYFDYANGNRTKQTNELGLATTMSYDNLNRLVCTIFPDSTTVSNQYKYLDVVAVKDRLGQWTQYGFDALRRLVNETNANGQVTQYGYCGCGSLSEIDRWNNGSMLSTYFSYDLSGKLTNVLYPDGYQLSYTYDDHQNVQNIVDSGGLSLSLDYWQLGPRAKVGDGFFYARRGQQPGVLVHLRRVQPHYEQHRSQRRGDYKRFRFFEPRRAAPNHRYPTLSLDDLGFGKLLL